MEQNECNVDNCFVEKKEEIYVSSLKVLKEYIVLKIYYNVMLKTKLVKSILIYENMTVSPRCVYLVLQLRKRAPKR